MFDYHSSSTKCCIHSGLSSKSQGAYSQQPSYYSCVLHFTVHGTRYQQQQDISPDVHWAEAEKKEQRPEKNQERLILKQFVNC